MNFLIYQRPFRLYVVALLIILFGISPKVGRSGDPDLVFRTIHTEHFRIYYHQGLEMFARQAGAIAEDVHQELCEGMGWEVSGRTDVRIVDSQDAANGMATASPSPFMLLYASPPELGSALQYHDDWLRTLIIHEYTHVIHLQTQHGIARIVNAVFGDVYLPNALQPRWFIEGLAVLNETYRTTMGRIRSSYYQMVVRTHALEGQLQTLGEVSNSTLSYPRGSLDYIYGAMFLHYLRDRFGEDALYAISHEYASAPLPYGINRVFKKITGVELTVLYEEWRTHITREAEETKIKLEDEGLTASTQITHSGESKGQPLFVPDGHSVIIPISDAKVRSGVFKLPLTGGPQERLFLSGSSAKLSMTDRGQIYYTRTAPYKDYYRFTDVFVLDAPGTDPRRLTHGMRAREAAVSPYGDLLAMVVNKNGSTELVLGDGEGNITRTLIPSQEGMQVYHPTFSPDGKKIVFVQRKGAQVDLIRLDLESNEFTNITNNYAFEDSPVFSQSGRYLFYSSDETGISNIYAKDFETGRVLKLTNVLTGAAKPAVSRDGKYMVYLQFSSDGWDIHGIPLDLENAPVVKPSTVENGDVGENLSYQYAEGDSLPYNPFPSFLPKAWHLSFSNSGTQNFIQASVGMSDAVGLHSLGVEFNYGFSDQNPSVAATYTFTGMLPTFQLNFSYVSIEKTSGYLVNGESASWTNQSFGGSAGLSVPIPGLDRNHSLSFGYALSYSEPKGELEVTVDPDGPLPDLPTQYFRAGLRFGWSFSDLYSSPLAVSLEKGRSLYANMTFYNPVFGGDQTLAAFFWGWKEYVPAPWADHHVFALYLSGGLYLSDPKGEAGFSAGGYGEQNIVSSIWNNTPMGLPRIRGYEPYSMSGDQVHSLRLEYRFPIWLAEVGYNTLPVFFRRLHGGIFTDNILISFDTLSPSDIRTSVGAELIWSFYLGYYMPMVLRTGYARGLMEEGVNEFILAVGGTF